MFRTVSLHDLTKLLFIFGTSATCLYTVFVFCCCLPMNLQWFSFWLLYNNDVTVMRGNFVDSLLDSCFIVRVRHTLLLLRPVIGCVHGGTSEKPGA